MNFLSESNNSPSLSEAEVNSTLISINDLQEKVQNMYKTMNIKQYEPADKRTLQMYIDQEIEPRETLGTLNPCQLKPSMKCSECSDEEWQEIEALIANPDVSKHICVQSTYSYTFFVYNSPKHGLVEITYSNWSGYYASVTPITRNYLASNIRPQEVKMTFDRYISQITSGYNDNFITQPTLTISDELHALIESKKDEIIKFYSFDTNLIENHEEYIKNLYITLGNIGTVSYFVTKTKFYLSEYERNKEYLILFAQFDEHNFGLTLLELS